MRPAIQHFQDFKMADARQHDIKRVQVIFIIEAGASVSEGRESHNIELVRIYLTMNTVSLRKC